MDLADPTKALEALREFLHLLNRDYHDWKGGFVRNNGPVLRKQPLIEQIAARIDPANVKELVEDDSSWGWHRARDETNRLIGILEDRDEREEILGAFGPTLAANRLHPWVWEAAARLWDGGHYDSAVHAAYKAVERQTQVSISRLDLDGKALYGQAFSIKDAPSGEKRLRFPDINRTEEPKRWTSAHEGAQNLGMGCAQGIRNPQAHPSPDITEQEALEQLAALSMLARWVDECKPVSVNDDPAGE